MCLFPRQIRNKNYRPNDGLSPFFINVPCGHCADCQRKRTSSYVFRSQYEYSSCIAKGGFAMFLTFTFNSDNLNIVTYHDKDNKKYTCSTWNNKAFRKLRNAFNMWLTRHDYSLRYLCTSERGHTGTYRPHYHAIFFVTPNNTRSLSYLECFQKVASLWSACPRANRTSCYIDYSNVTKSVPNTDYVAKYAPLGIVHSELVGRTELSAIRYICKYVTKSANEQLYLVTPEYIDDSSKGVAFDDMLPRLMISKDYGLDFFKDFHKFLFKDNYGTFQSDSPHIVARNVLDKREKCHDGSVQNIPRYYVNKLGGYNLIKRRFVVPDDRQTFDGKCVTPKFKKSTPYYRLDYDSGFTELTNYRVRTETETKKNSLGRTISYYILFDISQRLYNYLHSNDITLLDSRFAFDTSDYLAKSAFSVVSSSFTNSALNAVKTLSDIDFNRVFMWLYHADSTDMLILHNHPKLALPFIGMQYLQIIFKYNNTRRLSESCHISNKRYESNLLEMVKNCPTLFKKTAKDLDL